MGKIDWGKCHGTICGITEDGARYTQDEKRFNGKGIEVDSNGIVVDPSDLILDKILEEVPTPINNKEPELQRNWEAEKDPPSGFVGLTHDGFKNPEPVEKPAGCPCDTCGFVAKSEFGLRAHKRYKH